jgi:tRNA (guanine10-N2)-dimethyltransferase
LTPPNPSHRISGRSRSSGGDRGEKKILFLLSGESSTIPAAEASALVRMSDRSARVESPEGRVLVASSEADADAIAGRIAFSKRVGTMVPDGRLGQEQLRALRTGTYRISVFDLGEGDGRRDSGGLVSDLAEGIGGRVSLDDPDLEVTVVRGERDYLALTRPSLMRQGWATRRPRARPFFHPAAIFPKLSRALVNLSRVPPGGVFLDPFCGTGSLLLEAFELGARPLGADRDSRMVRGALRNMAAFGQDWLGVVRADVRSPPLSEGAVDGIATDIPYGRASSTSGSNAGEMMERVLRASSEVLGEGGRLVVMHPDTVEVGGGAGPSSEFEVEEEHRLYVHSKLTRTISVLRRV